MKIPKNLRFLKLIFPKIMDYFSSEKIKPLYIFSPIFLTSIVMVGFLFVKNPNMGNDGLHYHSVTHNFFMGNGWRNFMGTWSPVEPGYGILSYLLYLVIGDIEYSGMLVSAIAYVLLIPLIYRTVDFLFGLKTAILATFFVTFWPTLLSYSSANVTDVVYLFFLICGFSVFTKTLFEEKISSRSFLLGLILGMAYLIREPEGFVVAVFAVISLAIICYKHWLLMRTKNAKKDPWILVFWQPITMTFGFLLILLPYIVFIYTQTGVWSPSIKVEPVNSFENITIQKQLPQEDVAVHIEESAITVTPITSTITPQPKTIDHPTPFPAVEPVNKPAINFPNIKILNGFRAYSPSFENVYSNIDELVWGLFRTNFHAITILGIIWLVFPFLSAKRLTVRGFFGSRNKRIVISIMVFSSPVILHLSVPSSLEERFLMQYSIFLLITLASLSIFFLKGILESRKKSLSHLQIVFIGLLSVVIPIYFGTNSVRAVLETPHPHQGLREAGVWLAKNIHQTDDLVILSPRKGQIALFYASGKKPSFGKSIRINPDLSLQSVISRVNKKQVNYLLLDNHYVYWTPNMKPLWENPDLADYFGLELVFSDRDNYFQIYEGGK